MLRHLKIRNLALLEGVDLDFGNGFTAITGETGAGKSVLIGALSILTGARVEKTVIRQGAEACEVEALLEIPQGHALHGFLETQGLPPCEDGVLLLRKIIHLQKPAKAFVNGVLATGTLLQGLASYWIDFHGPEAPHRLAEEAEQRALLDAFSGVKEELMAYRVAYEAWKAVLKEMEALKQAAVLSEDEKVFYQSQLDKIEGAGVSLEAITALELAYNRQEKVEELLGYLNRLSRGLGREGGVSAYLGKLAREAQDLEAIDASMESLATRVNALLLEADDLSYEYAQALGRVGDEAMSAHDLDGRMNRWLEVKRAYGPTLEHVLLRQSNLRTKLQSQENVAERLAALELEAAVKEAPLKGLAEALDKKRRTAAVDLIKKVEALLPGLGLQRACLEISIEKAGSYQAHGQSVIQYRFSPNVGQIPLPLGKIASSGEMARVMLAFKAVLAAVDAEAVLVFDEVDANVGGEIGGAVGAQLARLGLHHQVFAVTHLPQVAAQAAHHILVTKTQESACASVHIAAIGSTHEARLTEIARMLGDRHSGSARQHAEVLLR